MSLQGKAPVPEPEPGAAPVSWNVQLEYHCCSCSQTGMGQGLALDLCDSNGLAYQAEGVQALKFGQNTLLEISGVPHAEDSYAFQHQLKMTSSFPPSMSSVWILKVLEQ